MLSPGGLRRRAADWNLALVWRVPRKIANMKAMMVR
jgi:hypothetical protein